MSGHDPRPVVWTSVFADGPGGGNPCPVVLDAAALSADQMQELTHGFGVETAFVVPPVHGGDVGLRYFVPLHEMEMCVHATVAAVVLLGRSGRLPGNPAAVETTLGTLDVSWDADASSAVVDQFPPVFGAPVAGDRVLAALRLSPDDIAGPIVSVSTARAKLMIPVRDEPTLDRIDPDFPALWDVCDDLAVTGFYPFTVDAAGADAAARQFPRRTGYPEDPATGVAACALGAYLAVNGVGGGAESWRRWTIAQGRAMGRPSLITAEALVDDTGQVAATRVGGRMQETSGPDHRGL